MPGGEQIKYRYDTRGNRIIASANDKGLGGFIPGEFSYNNWDELDTFTSDGTAYNYYYDPEGLRNKSRPAEPPGITTTTTAGLSPNQTPAALSLQRTSGVNRPWPGK